MRSALPLLLSFPVLLTSCSDFTAHSPRNEYIAFKSRGDYQETAEIYRNEQLLEQARPSRAILRVDLSDQRAQLLVENQVALDTPVCTGRPGKSTPVGLFPIKEKIKDKRSGIFGSLYRNGRKVFRGDRRHYRGRYDHYVGSALPFWMRLTNAGVGLHGSHHVHRYPRSNGCVRMPHEAVSTIYSVVGEGTPVQVEK